MYSYLYLGYLLYRYSDYIKYGYSAYCYSSDFVHWINHHHSSQEIKYDDDWVLCNEDDINAIVLD